jgi:predicted HD phosphohydrolase
MNIDKVYSYYDKYGGEGYIGESITQLEHAMQCALQAESSVKLIN